MTSMLAGVAVAVAGLWLHRRIPASRTALLFAVEVAVFAGFAWTVLSAGTAWLGVGR